MGLEQNSSFLRANQKEKTFIEKIDKIFGSTILYNDEEEENKKTFALIQMQNRNISNIFKSDDDSSVMSDNLIKKIKENKNKQRARLFLLASIKTRKLWENKNEKETKDNSKNYYKKININNKALKEKRPEMQEIKRPRKDLLISLVKNDVDELLRRENEKTYLRHAKIKQLQKNLKNNLTFREKRKKNIENDTSMELMNQTNINKNNYRGFNMYMDNYKKMSQKEENKGNNKNNKSMINSYVNMNYKKIKAKRMQNEIKENIGDKTYNYKLSTYDQEKQKIFKYNNKLIKQKLNEDLHMNDTTNEDEYYNVNNNSKINRNFIFENSNSYMKNINNISDINNYKKIINRNNYMLSERNTNTKQNIQENSSRLIQKYKLYPFLNKNNLYRTKENSLLNSLSNTNTQTPRNKKKNIKQNEQNGKIIKKQKIKDYNKYINSKK